MKACFFIFLISFSVSALKAQATKVAVINDLNAGYGSPTYSSTVDEGIKNIIEEKVDLVVIPGDMIAGGSRRLVKPEQFPPMWKAFSETIHKKFKEAGIPFAPSPGNHDASIWLQEDQKHYTNYFNKEENVPKVDFVDKTHYPFFYSYIHNNVFFISLDDTNIDWLRGRDKEIEGVHREWIKKQLASQVAREAKARIAYGHIPLYSVLNKDFDRRHKSKAKEVLTEEQFKKGNKDNLEQLFVEGNVDLAIFGHGHAYYPGYVKHKKLDSGLHMLFSPCLGNGERVLSGTKERSKRGYTIIDIDHAGKISYQVFTVDGQLLDSHALPKKIKTNDVTIHRDDKYLK